MIYAVREFRREGGEDEVPLLAGNPPLGHVEEGKELEGKHVGRISTHHGDLMGILRPSWLHRILT